MATIKKRVKKAQFGCGPGGCMRSAEGMTRREYRQMKRDTRQTDREVGDRPMQKLLKGIGISTQEGIERRQARKAERRAARGYKTGGKITKAKTGMKKAQDGKTLKAEFKMGPNPKLGMRKLEMDTSGYAAGAKRFPVTETTPGVGGKNITRKFATNRKGAASMIEKTQGKSKSVNLPIRRASSVKKQKSGGKTSKRK